MNRYTIRFADFGCSREHFFNGVGEDRARELWFRARDYMEKI